MDGTYVFIRKVSRPILLKRNYVDITLVYNYISTYINIYRMGSLFRKLNKQVM